MSFDDFYKKYFDPIGRNFQAPQHFLYFFPLPHGQGSFRPIFFFLVTGCFGGDDD